MELPYNIEAEQGICGSVLMEWDKVIYRDVVCDLQKEHFYDKTCGNLWECLKMFISQHSAGHDPVIFKDYLENNALLERCGGVKFLLEVQESVPSPHYSQYYAGIVIQDSKIRSEIEFLEHSLKKAYKGESVADEVVGRLSEAPVKDKHKTVECIYGEWEQAREGIRNSIPTPYPSMDRQTGGVRQGMVTIFTGRSKSGKSMFLSHWYNYLAEKDIPILVVPLEDKYDITIKRMSANYGKFKVSELDAGGYYINNNGVWSWCPTPEHTLKKAKESLKHVSNQSVFFYDKKCTPEMLRGVAKRYKRKHDIQAMFVDGAKDLLRPSGKYGDVGFDEEISQKLCEVAEELNIAVVAVHHLTKISDDDRINVNHIRGSGNIVGDSRAVYALQSSGIADKLMEYGYTPQYCTETGLLKSRIFECLVNNHGSSAMKFLETDLNMCQFQEAKKVTK